jgi:GTPase SAR1 family protein
MIYKGGIPDKEKHEYAVNIRRNCIECMQALIEARTNFNIEYEKGSKMEALDAELATVDADTEFTEELATKIQDLWQSDVIQSVFARKSEFWLLDGAEYYFENAQRIAEVDFMPTDEDMVMTRVRTTGIVVTEFSEGPITYSMVDVGGQRSERRKWINCFDDVKAVIFLVGLSGYNQVMFEDSSYNRMQESMELFSEVTKKDIFRDTPIFLFLNKKDLFEDMVKKKNIDIKTCFPEYTDGCDLDKSLAYIKEQYNSRMQQNVPGKKVYTHVIAARVRMDMKIAFGEVKDTLKNIYQNKKKK